MASTSASTDQLCINTIRTLSIDMIQKANSGHPGLPLGAAPMAYILWSRHLKHNPGDPWWRDRDRFVLSAGHGSALLYSLLHLFGYGVSMDDIKNFRQWESKTPGHPESYMTPGVEATTGPLGQGTSNAVGMAIAERMLASRFNRPGHEIVDHYTYALVSDGDLMEGISAEAASLAGHMRLGKLIYLYDSNDVTLDGPASLCFSTEDVKKRYMAYGWQVLEVSDGNTDYQSIDKAIKKAKAMKTKPSLIIVKTTIGYGSPNKSGKAASHGAPLGEEELKLTKQALGWEYNQPFFIPDEAKAEIGKVIEKGRKAQKKWIRKFNAYKKDFPELAAEWEASWNLELPDGWDSDIPEWSPGEKEATRVSGGKILNAIAGKVGWLAGGDADLSGSTKTKIKFAGSFEGQSGEGRNIHFGVREHAMAGIANGMSWHGGVRPFVSTFFVFSDYMKPSVRIATMSGLPVIYVWTHDSIAVGEDGPTHQPIEHLMALRIIPNMTVIRPADAVETVEAWKWIMAHKSGPSALVLSRQDLSVIDRSKYKSGGVAHGAYILSEPDDEPDAIIIASGSEVHAALEAQGILASDGIKARVVSMPSWEIFESQSEEYRRKVLPSNVTARVSIEAGSTFGWQKWTGEKGLALGIDRFGASAPGDENMEKFGMTALYIVRAVKSLLQNS